MSTDADRIWYVTRERRDLQNRIVSFLVLDAENEDGWVHVQEEIPPAITCAEAVRLHQMAVDDCRARGDDGAQYFMRSVHSANLAAALAKENKRLKDDLRRFEEREAHWAEVLRIADRGRYRADWDSRIRFVVRRMEEAEALIERISDLDDRASASATDIEHILASHEDQIPDYLRALGAHVEKIHGEIALYAKIIDTGFETRKT